VIEDLRGRRPFWLIVVVAVVGGLLLGPVDLLAQRTLPHPWVYLASSSAVWTIGAFGIGLWVRAGRWRSAFAGGVLLLVAVGTYHLAAALFLDDDLDDIWSLETVSWLFLGVLAGAVFGLAGGVARGGNRWLRMIGIAFPGAVLFAEATLRANLPIRGVASVLDNLTIAATEAALGVLLPLIVGRTAWERLGGLVASVPLALIFFTGFRAAGMLG
jgi:hypothetical protein